MSLFTSLAMLFGVLAMAGLVIVLGVELWLHTEHSHITGFYKKYDTDMSKP